MWNTLIMNKEMFISKKLLELKKRLRLFQIVIVSNTWKYLCRNTWSVLNRIISV